MPLDDANYLNTDQRILLKAAEIVRERWQQGSFGENGGPRCALGAIAEACGHDLKIGEGCHAAACGTAAAKRLAKQLHIHVAKVMAWNDAPGRTADEVAAVMERVALSHVRTEV